MIMKLKFFLLGVVATFILTFMFQRCMDKGTSTTTSFSDDYKKKLITKDQEKVLYDNYTQFNYLYINEKRNGVPDSREYYYTLDELQGYLNFVQSEAKAKGYSDVGIKIKMGQYPQKDAFTNMNPKYQGYQTIYLVPTKGGSSVKTAQVNPTPDPDPSPSPFGEETADIPSLNLVRMGPPF